MFVACQRPQFSIIGDAFLQRIETALAADFSHHYSKSCEREQLYKAPVMKLLRLYIFLGIYQWFPIWWVMTCQSGALKLWPLKEWGQRLHGPQDHAAALAKERVLLAYLKPSAAFGGREPHGHLHGSKWVQIAIRSHFWFPLKTKWLLIMIFIHFMAWELLGWCLRSSLYPTEVGVDFR